MPQSHFLSFGAPRSMAIAIAAIAFAWAASVAHAVTITPTAFREFLTGKAGANDFGPERIDAHDDIDLLGTVNGTVAVVGNHKRDGQATTEAGNPPLALVDQTSFFSGTAASVFIQPNVASARVIYEFTLEASGPVPAGVRVPIEVAIDMGAVSSGGAFAGATVAIVSGTAPFLLEVVSTCGRAGTVFIGDVCTDDDDDRQNITALRRIEGIPDQLFEVTKFAFGATLPVLGTSKFTAFADPFIRIAPDFEFRDLFRLRFSDGLCGDPFCSETQAQVPEPGTWVLAASGAALLCALPTCASRARRPRGSGAEEASSVLCAPSRQVGA